MGMKKGECMYREYVYDFAVDGGATGDLEMRAADPNAEALETGTLVKDCIAINETLLTGGTALTFGTKTDPDGFLADSYAALTALNTVVRAGEVAGALLWDTTEDAKKAYRVSSTANDQKVVMNIGTTPITAGKLRVILELYKPGTELG